MSVRMMIPMPNPRIPATAAKGGERCVTCSLGAAILFLTPRPAIIPACEAHTRPVFDELNAAYPANP